MLSIPRAHVLASCVLLVLLALLSSSTSPSSSSLNVATHTVSSSAFPSLLTVSAIGKKLTEKELGEIEDQWMEDEVEDEDDTPFKYKRTPDGGRMPPTPDAPKSEMAFVSLTEDEGRDKHATDIIAGKWTDQMQTAGIDVRGYTTDANRILFVCDQRGYRDMSRVRAFVLRQKETMEFEWGTAKSKPSDVAGEKEPDLTEVETEGMDQLKKFQAMQDEQEKEAKIKAKRAKRAAEKKKKEKAKKKKEKERKKKEKAEKKKKAAEEAAAKAAAAEQQKSEL